MTVDNPVSCTGLGVRYGRKVALEAVGLTVEAGQVYALLGRNGAGKSTLLRCLLGLQKPGTGTARLFGQNIWTTRAKAMGRIGVVPEEPDAPPHMTVQHVTGFCKRLYASWDDAGVAARLDRFAIGTRTLVGQLSRGQKAQLSMALALGHRPELLILDDPTLGLDAVARKHLYGELVGELADRGTTVLLTTHDLTGIEGIANRVGILRQGRMAVEEDLETLKARHRRIRLQPASLAPVASALAAMRVLITEQAAWGVEAWVEAFDEAAFQQVRTLAPEAEAEPLSLEELFIKIVDTRKEVRP